MRRLRVPRPLSALLWLFAVWPALGCGCGLRGIHVSVENVVQGCATAGDPVRHETRPFGGTVDSIPLCQFGVVLHALDHVTAPVMDTVLLPIVGATHVVHLALEGDPASATAAYLEDLRGDLPPLDDPVGSLEALCSNDRRSCECSPRRRLLLAFGPEDAAATPVLEAYLRDRDPRLRRVAQRALERVRGP